MSSTFQLSGLASGFDWKSFVDQLIAVSHAPADRLAAEKTLNNQKVGVFTEFGTKLTALEASVGAFGVGGVFGQHKAVSTTTGSTWISSASPTTAIGGYKIAVSRLATAAHRDGAANIGSSLSATSDVSALTIANLPTGSAVSAGTFSVNGAKVTVALTDSLADVFAAISTATAGTVTAAYDPATDKVTLSGTGEVVLGAANDTSNFLAALKLGNNGTASVTSSAALGTIKTSAALASANLSTAITAVDGTGAGTFTINGVSIAYNVNTDTLSGILTRINQSGAGVTAAYDPSNDRVSLANTATGDIGIGVSEDAGGLLGALGLTGGGTLVHGVNAEFTINDGAPMTSLSNTLDDTVHGVAGLVVTINTTETQNIQVAADSTGMRSKIDDFIAKFNAVQSYIDSVTKVSTDSSGKVTAALLSNNREIQSWGSSLRSVAFSAVSGLTGTISRLENLGIDFKSGTSELEIKDSAKLDTALRNKSEDVAAFFGTATTGFVDKIKALTTAGAAENTARKTSLGKSNTSLDAQIADIERRLVQQRAIMESAFINMEMAQAQLTSQQSALSKAFATTTS